MSVKKKYPKYPEVHVFDYEKNHLDCFKSVLEASRVFNIPTNTIRQAMDRESIVDQKYYFSADKLLKAEPDKKYSHNPVAKKKTPKLFSVGPDWRNVNEFFINDEFNFNF